MTLTWTIAQQGIARWEMMSESRHFQDKKKDYFGAIRRGLFLRELNAIDRKQYPVLFLCLQ
jgi:hypothetical protein